MKIEVPFSLYNGKVTGKFIEDKETGYHAYFVTDEENGLKNFRPKGCTTVLGIKDKSRPLVSWATELAEDTLLDMIANGEEITPEAITMACSLHEVRKQEAATIGDIAHDWCEQYIKFKIGEKDSLPDLPKEIPVKRCVLGFLEWEEQHNVNFISSERIIYSRKHKRIGKMDIEAEVDGELSLVDIKTSSGLYNSVKMQTGFYAKADMEENPKKKYVSRWALRLAKESEEEYNERMNKKNDKRIMKGKESVEYPEYQTFEAMKFEETEEDNIDKDMEAFLACSVLIDWDDNTDFYKKEMKRKADFKKNEKDEQKKIKEQIKLEAKKK